MHPDENAAVIEHGPSATNSADAVLDLEGISKSFRRGIPGRRTSVAVLKGVDLEVHAGELVGLVGENGSGKSVLMKIIVGLLGRDGGTVEHKGALGYCPQLSVLWEKLTVAEHFELFTRAYDLARDEGRKSSRDLMDELQFARYFDYRVENLSGGTRQKLNLALALMHEPALLLLDEPYAGFDWETYLRFWEMAETRRANGMAIMVVSHLLSERDRLTRIYSLSGGRAVEE